MKKSALDDLAAQQTRESIAIRMEAFADEFERLASTAKQVALAESFSLSVHGIVARNPLTAADLEPLGKWLSGNGDQFEQMAKSPEQKQLAASFRGFIAEIGSQAVKDVLQRPLVNRLVADIQWELAEGASNGIPFAWLSHEDKKAYLVAAIDWTDCLDRGLELEPDTAARIDRITENAIAGKPCKEWMGRTDSLAERFRGLLNLPPDQPARTPEKEKDRGIER